MFHQYVCMTCLLVLISLWFNTPATEASPHKPPSPRDRHTNTVITDDSDHSPVKAIVKRSLRMEAPRIVKRSHGVDRRSPVHWLKRSSDMQVSDPIAYLSSIPDLHPVDVCLLGCRTCFTEVRHFTISIFCVMKLL